MKAFLLAAGEGTRLRPLTNDIPKCLVPICGRPLIEYWFDLFRRYNIDEVLINTSYLSEKVTEYVHRNAKDLKIVLKHEKSLLGSGGTIKANWRFVSEEKAFFICYADNLTNINLARMLDIHNKTGKDFTLALFRVNNPHECGIVILDDSSTIISFEEKPEHPESDLAFSGIMVSNHKLIEYFPQRNCFDLGYDVLPEIVNHAAGYILNEYLIDIGTPEKLQKAEYDVCGSIFSKVQ